MSNGDVITVADMYGATANIDKRGYGTKVHTEGGDKRLESRQDPQ